MKLISFIVDARPYHGFQTIYVNPDEVVSVTPTSSMDNPTAITLRSGKELHVKGYSDEVFAKLCNDTAP